jgi:putative serine/threonine protein kinase
VKPPAVIPVEKLNLEPYASIVCYPRASATGIQNRIEELQKRGVQALEFAGNASAFSVPVLGKGYVGIVAIAHLNGKRLALKMRRVDADRKGLEHEAELLIAANSVGVGPNFIAATTDFLFMQLIEGDFLYDWLEKNRDNWLERVDPAMTPRIMKPCSHMYPPIYRGQNETGIATEIKRQSEKTRKILVDILEQCWRLDEIGLDHGELSKAPKHLLVDRASKPFIVDFETASINRKVANVTAVCQFLFLGNSNAGKMIAEILGERNRSQLINALKAYKKNRIRSNFERLIEVCLS